jgi:hypothetical protein
MWTSGACGIHRMTHLSWLTLGAFAIGTEGFMIAGLLPVLVRDLNVGLAAAGHLVTVRPLPKHFVQRAANILRLGRLGCLIVGKPVPPQAGQSISIGASFRFGRFGLVIRIRSPETRWINS